MAQLLRMPEVAAGGTSATLAAWSVNENSSFSAQDTLAEIETDKAIVDLDAETDGIVLKALVPAGAQVAVGDPIALLGTPDEQDSDINELLATLGVASSAPASSAPGSSAASVDVNRPEVPDDPIEHAEATVGETLSDAGTDAPPSEPVQQYDGPTGAADTNGRIFASPLARRLAKEAGLSLAELSPGTGPGDRVRRADVEAVIARQGGTKDAAATMTRNGSAERSEPAEPPAGGDPPHGSTDIPHSRIRIAIAQRLTESKQNVPHFYLQGSAHVAKLLKLRARLNASGETKLSVNDLVIKAAARAHTLVPAMNVIWTPKALRQFSTVDVSVAISTDRGLVTPVLRSVETLSVGAVATSVRDFIERAKLGKLRQNELEGGSFSVTNLGMFGVDDFAAIINPPQSAILAVGVAQDEVVVRRGKPMVGSVMRFTLSVDHRAVDGALAAQWLQSFVSVLENPYQILL